MKKTESQGATKIADEWSIRGETNDCLPPLGPGKLVFISEGNHFAKVITGQQVVKPKSKKGPVPVIYGLRYGQESLTDKKKNPSKNHCSQEGNSS